MKKFPSLISSLFCSLLAFNLTSAQSEILTCEQDINVQEGLLEAVEGGRFKPSSNSVGEYFRALVVFAQFAGDNNIVPDWPKDSLPNWAYDIIDSVPAMNYRSQTISDYFKKMSGGNFDFIGDVHPNIITVQNDLYYSYANINVINQLNNQIINFHKYDNWYFQDSVFYFSQDNGDGYLDMLIIIYRWGDKDNWFGLAGGIANLGFGTDIITHDSIRINGSSTNILGSGITTQRRGRPTNRLDFAIHLAHEYGHYLFGGNHTNVSGLMPGVPYMYEGGTYAMSAWERERLGYIPIQAVYNGQTKRLRDFITYGDAIRIPITSTEYFLIENHQRINPFDQVIRGGSKQGNSDTTSQIGKGIYAWYVKNGDIYPPTIYAITADGSWKWKFVRWETMYGWDDPPPVLAILDRDITYRYLPNNMYYEDGKCDRNSKLFFKIDDVSYHRERWHDIDPFTKIWVLSYEAHGDETDAFNFDYNDQFTPWSNPSSTKLSGGIAVPTNISFKLYYVNGIDIDIKVFTNETGALNLPPSKPQNLGIAWSNNHPKLTWETSIEPDMQSYKIWKYAAGSAMIAATIIHNPANPTHTWTDYNVDRPKKIAPGIEYIYKVKSVDNTNIESVYSDQVSINGIGDLWKDVEDEPTGTTLVNEYKLFSNYPNPFNPSTVISYSIKEAGLVKLKVYDILGREVVTLVNERKEAGYYSVEFNASNLPSGVYIYRMLSGDFVSLKKMLLIK